MGFTSEAPEDRILSKRLEEACQTAQERGYPRFVGFLDERQHGVAQMLLRGLRAENTAFFGGYEGAERTFFGAFPSFYEPDFAVFPLEKVAFFCRAGVRLDHRQVLGTLMSQGVRREKLGDILCGDGLCVAFADQTIGRFLAEQVDRIGGEGVKAVVGYDGPLPTPCAGKPLEATVASPRLDAVVKALLGCSREEAVRRITAGRVLLDHAETRQADVKVGEGAVISLRGSGRYRIEQIGPPTKKGRLFLKASKFV